MDDKVYKELLESLECCVLKLDERGAFTYCSPKVKELLGYEPEELTGKHILELLAPNQQLTQKDVLKMLMELNKPVRQLELSFLHTNEQCVSYSVDLNPTLDSSGRALGFQGLIRLPVAPTRSEYEHIPWTEAIEKIAEAVLIVSPDLNISFANGNFYALFGYQPDDVLGQSLTKLGVDEQHPSLRSTAVVEAVLAKGFWQGEVKRRAKNGQYIPVLLNAKPYFDSRGVFKGYIGTYQDLRSVNTLESNIKKAMLSVVEAVSGYIEHRTTPNVGHQRRVADLCIAIGLELGMEYKSLEGLKLGALIHDIGKLRIPPEIASKRGPLTEIEESYLRKHPLLGYEIIKDLRLPWPVAGMILQHHEKIDGSGYPNQLQGAEILLEARIIAVVDGLEEICTSPENVELDPKDHPFSVLEKRKGTFYDPDIVDTCLKVVKTGQFQHYLSFHPGNGSGAGFPPLRSASSDGGAAPEEHRGY